MVADSVRQPDPPILVVEGYSKSYGGKRVVEDVSLSVLPGSIFGFVGHNGAGKTTLIRSIAGALSFDDGDVRICGKSVRTDPVACKQVTAHVPDSPDVYGFLTGMQYLDYVADLFCVGSDERTRRSLAHTSWWLRLQRRSSRSPGTSASRSMEIHALPSE